MQGDLPPTPLPPFIFFLSFFRFSFSHPWKEKLKKVIRSPKATIGHIRSPQWEPLGCTRWKGNSFLCVSIEGQLDELLFCSTLPNHV